MIEIRRLSLRPLFYLFAVLYLILAMHLPAAIYTTASHDDGLFLINAYQILTGHWLGDYSQMTLIKGAGFPLFLAANAVLGIPVTLSIAIFYLFSCVLIANTLHKTGVNKYWVLAVFVVILFHPELFPARITRDNIYSALALIILSGVINFLFTPSAQNLRLINIVPYGLALGFFWITREEGIWIIPGLLLLLFLKALQLKKQNASVHYIFYRFSGFFLTAILFVCSIAVINYYKYGKFEVVDFKGQAFSQAIKSLNSVDVGEDLPYLPVSFAKRQIIYKVSPSFVQLKDYFEDKGKHWTAFGCAIYPQTCGDYAAGWFMWALRDAVASKGYYKKPITAAEFYNNITKEIETACDTGVIKCKTNPVPFMPNITITQLKEFPEKMLLAFKIAMVQLPLAVIDNSWEPLRYLEKERRFLGNPRTTPAPSEQTTELSGWFYAENLNDWIVFDCAIKEIKIRREIARINSPDIAEKFHNPTANFQRFSTVLPNNEDCKIAMDSSSSNGLPVKALLEKQKVNISLGNNSILFIEKIVLTKNDAEQIFSSKARNLLAGLYKFIIPVIVLPGAIIYIVYLFSVLLNKVLISDIFIASTMLWCLFFSRTVMLVLIEISSFPAINSLYMSAAFPVLCLAGFLSLQLFSENKTNLDMADNK